MIKKVAMFKDISCGFLSESVCDVNIFKRISGYVQITETVEVEFTLLNDGEAEKQEIAIIEKKITEEMAESESRLTKLKQRKQELLAIGSE